MINIRTIIASNSYRTALISFHVLNIHWLNYVHQTLKNLIARECCLSVDSVQCPRSASAVRCVSHRQLHYHWLRVEACANTIQHQPTPTRRHTGIRFRKNQHRILRPYHTSIYNIIINFNVPIQYTHAWVWPTHSSRWSCERANASHITLYDYFHLIIFHSPNRPSCYVWCVYGLWRPHTHSLHHHCMHSTRQAGKRF